MRTSDVGRRTPGGLLAVGLLLAAIAAACGSDFKPQSLVETPRILGIVAEPPEAGFDQAVAIRGLLSFGEKFTDLKWTLCPFYLGAQGAYACATPELPLASGTDSTSVPAGVMDPLLGAIASNLPEYLSYLRQVVPESETCQRKVIADWDACSAQHGATDAGCVDAATSATLACLHKDGMEVAVRLVATTAAGAEPAVKRVVLRDPTAGRVPNANPSIVSIAVGKQVVLDGDHVVTAPETKLEMLPTLADGAAQSYAAADGSRATEVLFLSWYATGGDFETIRTDPDVPKNHWTAPKAADWKDPIRFWVFVRDDRLGQGVTTFTVDRSSSADGAAADADASATVDADVADAAAAGTDGPGGEP